MVVQHIDDLFRPPRSRRGDGPGSRAVAIGPRPSPAYRSPCTTRNPQDRRRGIIGTPPARNGWIVRTRAPCWLSLPRRHAAGHPAPAHVVSKSMVGTVVGGAGAPRARDRATPVDRIRPALSESVYDGRDDPASARTCARASRFSEDYLDPGAHAGCSNRQRLGAPPRRRRARHPLQEFLLTRQAQGPARLGPFELPQLRERVLGWVARRVGDADARH